MGRRPFGPDRVKSAILEIADRSRGGVIDSPPLKKILAHMNREGNIISELTLRKYIHDLETENVIRIILGGRGGREFIALRVVQWETGHAAGSNAPPAQPIPAPAPKNPAPTRNASVDAKKETVKPNIAILLDYDNTYISAREAGFSVSFAKIMAQMRALGNIVFAEAYVSLRAIQRPEIVSSLSNVGFDVFLCPQSSKEADSVDTRMNWRGRQYVDHTDASLIVIISRDRDFWQLTNFAANAGKVAVFFDILIQQSAVEGYDDKVEIPHSHEHERMEKAFRCLEQNFPAINPNIENSANYLKAVLSALRLHYGLKSLSFNSMTETIATQLGMWNSTPAHVLKAALTVLVEQKAIQLIRTEKRTVYSLNITHPIFKFHKTSKAGK